MLRANQLLKRLVNPITLVIVVALIVFSYECIDRQLVDWLYNNLGLYGSAVPLLKWVTQLGNSGINLTLFFVAALLFRYVFKNSLWEARAWFLWLCLVFSNVVCGVLKVVFGRARPDLWLQAHEFGFSWMKLDSLHMSFPSGHTTTIMSITLGFSVLFPRFWGWFISVGILVALSRVLLLQHYLSDVLAAMYLTLLVVTGLVTVLIKKQWLPKIFLNNNFSK